MRRVYTASAVGLFVSLIVAAFGPMAVGAGNVATKYELWLRNPERGVTLFSTRLYDRREVELSPRQGYATGFEVVDRASDSIRDLGDLHESLLAVKLLDLQVSEEEQVAAIESWRDVDALVQVRQGWPFRSFTWTAGRRNNVMVHDCLIRAGNRSQFYPVVSEAIPIRPLVFGIVANALFFIIVVWLLMSIVPLLRGLWWARANRCFACGYSRHELGSLVCPECGATFAGGAMYHFLRILKGNQ